MSSFRAPSVASSLVVLVLVGACVGPSPEQRPGQPLAGTVASEILQAHNEVRRRAAVPPLRWDWSLAGQASLYARQLSDLGRLEHASRSVRGGAGENLWMGTAGAFVPSVMVRRWAAEKAQFRPGRFPQVSSTGEWQDVGHYTQMVWPTTTAVGCGLASRRGWDYLVCRYTPAAT